MDLEFKEQAVKIHYLRCARGTMNKARNEAIWQYGLLFVIDLSTLRGRHVFFSQTYLTGPRVYLDDQAT